MSQRHDKLIVLIQINLEFLSILFRGQIRLLLDHRCKLRQRNIEFNFFRDGNVFRSVKVSLPIKNGSFLFLFVFFFGITIFDIILLYLDFLFGIFLRIPFLNIFRLLKELSDQNHIFDVFSIRNF